MSNYPHGSLSQLQQLQLQHQLQQNHHHHQHHHHLPPPPPHLQLTATTATLPPQQIQQQQRHNHTPTTTQCQSASALASTAGAAAAAAAAAASILVAQPPQPLISNSLAIRQEIQRFESVHPSIYAIYDLIDLLPMPDAQIAQQIRDHVVCIEAAKPDQHGLILNSQAKKAMKNLMEQLPCGFPEYGVPPLAPYTNADLNIHLAQSVVDSLLQFLRFRFDGLETMEIKKLKISYTFSKKVQFHFKFKELKASAHYLNTDTLIDLLKELGLSVEYEGSGPLAFSLEDLSIQGSFKYKMPFIFGSIKIYKFECVVALGGCTSHIGGILGNGRFNEMVNDIIEYQVPAFVNGRQKEISDKIEAIFVPLVNEKMKGHKVWYLLKQLPNLNRKCTPTPAPWLAVQ